MLAQLRFGRGVDNRRFKAAGFEYGYTSREAVIALAEHLRLHPLLRDGGEPYRYEREVEEFLRWSPNVRNSRPKEVAAAMAVSAPPPPPVDHYDDLEAEEVLPLLRSLERGDLEALREYERGHRARESVMGAIETHLIRP